MVRKFIRPSISLQGVGKVDLGPFPHPLQELIERRMQSKNPDGTPNSEYGKPLSCPEWLEAKANKIEVPDLLNPYKNSLKGLPRRTRH